MLMGINTSTHAFMCTHKETHRPHALMSKLDHTLCALKALS